MDVFSKTFGTGSVQWEEILEPNGKVNGGAYSSIIPFRIYGF